MVDITGSIEGCSYCAGGPVWGPDLEAIVLDMLLRLLRNIEVVVLIGSVAKRVQVQKRERVIGDNIGRYLYKRYNGRNKKESSRPLLLVVIKY